LGFSLFCSFSFSGVCILLNAWIPLFFRCTTFCHHLIMDLVQFCSQY
jgi:hypothetical protein